MMKTRHNNNMTDHISMIYIKMKMSYHDRFDLETSVMKTRQTNNVIERTSVVYNENDIELLWSIGLGVIYDQN